MYIPLYVKTDYSLLSSLIKVDNLIKKLKEYNITSCGIVDNNLFGTMEIKNKFEKNGIKPIIGLEINIFLKEVLLYAENEDGYKNLIKIERAKQEENLSIDVLSKYKDNILCICNDINDYKKLKPIFNNIFLGVKNKTEEELYKKEVKDLVYVNKTLYLESFEYKYLPYVFMIRDGKTISEGIEFIYKDNYLYSDDELVNRVSSTVINNTLKVGELCNITFSKNLYMPKYTKEDSKEYLINLSKKGLLKRFNGNVSDIYKERLKKELDVIISMHFEDYFLVVYDFIKYAKKNNILVGPGRGSAAGSLVSYSLGITEVDPIKYDLLFERFLNKDRITMPDIDTDFPDLERDKVIEYVKEKYGEDCVSGIITFSTTASKQAVRDVGRVLNIPLKDIDYICKNMLFKEELKDTIKRNKDISNMIKQDEKLKLLYTIVSLISNNKRHTSIHAAGIVISRKPILDIVPVYKNSDGINLTEYTMEYLEELGLIKMDFLGIKNLTIIENIIRDIKENEGIEINFNDIPLNDKKVIELFANKDTTGIFQFESEGMKKFLTDLKPKTFNDICAAIALFRPGPASNIPSYIRRKEGKEKIDYLVDELKPILEETYGIIVYQEQIMKIANVMASYTLAEADILRRAMSKKKYDVLSHEEERFIKGSIENGYTKEKAKEVFDLILKFANYGFNKSHSVSYSIVAYKMAYLKYYYPKYFYGNLLSSVVGAESKTIEYLNEIKKAGIKILPPDVNKSLATSFKIEKEGIRFPLSSIRGVGGVISFLIEEHKEYKDIFDFMIKTYPKTSSSKVFESLVYSHALSSFGYNINTLINNEEKLFNYAELKIDIEGEIEKPFITLYDELQQDELLEKEKEIFGFYLTSHKTEKFKLNNPNIKDVYDLKDYLNKNVDIIVNIDKIKEITTKKNEIMAFITGTDNTGSISITLFPDIYKLNISKLKKNNIVKVSGKVEKRFNEYQVIAQKID